MRWGPNRLDQGGLAPAPFLYWISGINKLLLCRALCEWNRLQAYVGCHWRGYMWIALFSPRACGMVYTAISSFPSAFHCSLRIRMPLHAALFYPTHWLLCNIWPPVKEHNKVQLKPKHITAYTVNGLMEKRDHWYSRQGRHLTSKCIFVPCNHDNCATTTFSPLIYNSNERLPLKLQMPKGIICFCYTSAVVHINLCIGHFIMFTKPRWPIPTDKHNLTYKGDPEIKIYILKRESRKTHSIYIAHL